MEHMESLIKGHFDEDPDHTMTRAKWEAIAEDSAKKASDAQELLCLKKNKEDVIQAKVIVAMPPLNATIEDHGPCGPRKPN